MPTRSPTFPEVLDKLRQRILQDLRVALPGVVQKYDAATQLADVQPQLQDFFYDADDSTTAITLPVVTNVPVQWPAGGGFYMTAPLAVGDSVTLLFHDRSLDAWLAQGGLQNPTDQRRHNLSDAVAIPGLNLGLAGVPTDGAFMGKSGLGVKVTASGVQVGGADDYVALAAQVLSQLTALAAALTTGVSTLPADSGAGLKAALTTLFATPWPASVASSTIQVKS